MLVATVHVASGNSLFHNSLYQEIWVIQWHMHVQVLYLHSSPMEWCLPIVISAFLIAVNINKILHYLQLSFATCEKQ